jgi:hypothetical protein
MHLGILALFPISFAASGLAAGQKWVVPYPMIFSSLPFSHKTYPENALGLPAICSSTSGYAGPDRSQGGLFVSLKVITLVYQSFVA